MVHKTVTDHIQSTSESIYSNQWRSTPVAGRMSKVKINKHLKMIVITTNIKYIIFHIREVLMLYNLYDFTVAQLCYLYQYNLWSFKCKKIFIIEDSNIYIYIFLINCTTAVLYMGLISLWSGVYIFKKIYLS